MKSLIFVFIFAVIAAASSLPTEDEIFTETLRQQRQLEIYGSTRGLIDTLVNNLRETAKKARDTISSFTSRLRDEAQKIRDKMTSDVKRLQDRVSGAINEVANRFSNAGSDISSCVTSHSDEARLLFNDTITKGMDCVNQRISEINEQIHGLSNTATEAIAFSNKALEDMRKCTAENAGNFISTGTCLGRVAVQTEMKAIVFASQSALTIGRISLSMATLPAALEVCAGSRLVDVGITTSKIVMEIGSCSASSVFTTFIGGTSGNSFVTAEVNPPVEIKIW